MSMSKILAAGLERTTIGLYFRNFMLSDPPGPIMNLRFYLISISFMPFQWTHLTGNDAILVSEYLSG